MFDLNYFRRNIGDVDLLMGTFRIQRIFLYDYKPIALLDYYRGMVMVVVGGGAWVNHCANGIKVQSEHEVNINDQ